ELASTPGRGSRFSITVPRAPAPVQVRRSPRASRRLEAPAADTLRGRRVVVVDDDRAVIAAMRALFASWDMEAVGGPDATMAIAALGDKGAGGEGADLTAADLRLADGKSGIDATAQWRQQSGSDPPAIVVSGDTSAAAHAELQAAGLQLLVKP